MSAKEIYDYVSTVTPDNDVTLTIAARGTVKESVTKNQVIHLFDDGSEERISFSNNSVFYIEYPWGALSESDAGTIFDFFNDSSKGNGRMESFKLTYTYGSTTHTYVVRFESMLDRLIKLGNIHTISVVFKVLGRIAD